MNLTSTLLLIFAVLTFVLWLWAVLDVIYADFKNPAAKVLVLIGLHLVPIFGSIIYFQFKRQLVVKKKRRFKPKFV